MAYLQYGYRLWESDTRLSETAIGCPRCPDPGGHLPEGRHLEEDFFPRTKTLCVLLSHFAWGWWARPFGYAGPRPGLGTYAGSGLYSVPLPAAYVQAEGLYYTSSGLVFIGALGSCGDPSVGAVALGAVMGLTYLTKASILPAVGLAAVLLAARQGWAWWRSTKPRAKRPPPAGVNWRKCSSRRRWSATYLVTISPYLYNSKKIYGYAFYNVNSTFYIWCDSFQQAKDNVRNYDDRRAYPDIPPDKVPSAQRYLATHTPSRSGRDSAWACGSK